MRYLIVFFCFFYLAVAKAQSITDLIPSVEEVPRQISDTLDRNYDDRLILVKPIENDLKKQYTGNEFNYVETAAQKGSNAFARAIGAFFDWIDRVFGFTISPFWRSFFKYFFYGMLAVILLYFIIRLLMDDNPAAILSRKNKKLGNVIIEDSHIEDIDLKSLIDKQIQNGQYREAIRYMYLDVLKSLSVSSLIEWDFQKTNTDYYNELNDPNLKKQFKKISYIYDYIWYGEFPIDKEAFMSAQKEFMTIQQYAA